MVVCYLYKPFFLALRPVRKTSKLEIRESIWEWTESLNRRPRVSVNCSKMLLGERDRDRMLNVQRGLIADAHIVWAEHGETVSKAYSGTGALKADYTRTGKRTKQGLLEDGYKSAMRYILNNFFDGDRQVGQSCFFVYFTLHHVASSDKTTRFAYVA